MQIKKIKEILLKGSFRWGCSTALLWSVGTTFYKSPTHTFDIILFIKTFIFAIIIFPVFGILYGYLILQKEKTELKFILINGVLCWGCFTAILGSIIMTILQSTTHTLDIDVFKKYFSKAIFIFPLFGIIYGYLVFKFKKKQ